MSELLVEVRGDGFPVAEVEAATRRLKDRLVAQLREIGLPARQSATGCSAQRLMVLLRGIPDTREEQSTERRNRMAAAVGAAIEGLRWEDEVSWGDHYRWGAPVVGLLALLDGQVVPAKALGIEASGATSGPASDGGRRFLPTGGDDYGRQLARRGVEVRLAARLSKLERAVEKAASELGLMVDDDTLLEGWAAACETPSVVVCRLGDSPGELPAEIVSACLAERQGALPLFDSAGNLSTHFLAIVDRNDSGADRAATGNERAARDHLEDARFHFDRDSRTPLAQRVRATSDLADSHETALGGQSRRLEVLCNFLARELGSPEHLDASVQAAGLLYADRQSETVREFPRLAGIVGGLLAREEGYPASVWQAIYDTGQPRELPRSRAGEILFVADSVDRLVDSADREISSETRTHGSNAPANQIAGRLVNMVERADLELDLALAIAQSVRQRVLEEPAAVLQYAMQTVDQAMRTLLAEEGVNPEEIDAVLLARGTSSVPSVFTRVRGLRSLRGDSRLVQVANSARRMRDVLLESREEELHPDAFEEPAEIELYHTWLAYEPKLTDALASNRFDRWLDALYALDGSVQTFLSRVLVHDANESLQRNRLALLQDLQRAYAGPIRLVELPPAGAARSSR